MILFYTNNIFLCVFFFAELLIERRTENMGGDRQCRGDVGTASSNPTPELILRSHKVPLGCAIQPKMRYFCIYPFSAFVIFWFGSPAPLFPTNLPTFQSLLLYRALNGTTGFHLFFEFLISFSKFQVRKNLKKSNFNFILNYLFYPEKNMISSQKSERK